jgi:hypothetical protein
MMEVYRQRIIIDVVWTEPSDQTPEKIDWQAELSQTLNEANNYCGTIWQLETEPIEHLKAIRNIN